MYSAVTHNIAVSVEPFFLDDRSDPAESRYVWAYRVTIDNQSDEAVKLLSRYWHITDGAGRVEEVRGPGVVGEQPELDPGDSYQYMSGCPLSTPSGFMVGRYTMRNSRGELFDIEYLVRQHTQDTARTVGLLDGWITGGQAFGGDLEADGRVRSVHHEPHARAVVHLVIRSHRTRL